MKYLWMTVGIMALVGICLVVAGFAMGANGNGFYFDQNGMHMNTGEYTLTKEAEIGDISKIKINVASMDVRFIQADHFGYEVYAQDGKRIDCSYENSELEIRQHLKANFLIFSFDWQQEYVNIYLPESAQFDLVDVRTASGKVSIESIDSETFYMSQMSGDAEIERLDANEATIKSSSGHIKIKSAKANHFDISVMSGDLTAVHMESNGLKADLASGKADLRGSFTGNTEIKALSGKVSMEIDGAEQDYNRNISVMSGDVYINGAKAGAGNIDFKAANSLNIRVSSGNAEITFLK